ncbi:hypothetical protein BCV70DRAFT_34011 [Testicularia cyperi]|uniref:Uncharacterized protein n=1 Tax=Testicularia cyperi TaxID=1882483 RepID=A0A317XMN4_9BASI|nr:hypothetical protein BCV70DRAFT_34011 [Testicularia cyperi]
MIKLAKRIRARRIGNVRSKGQRRRMVREAVKYVAARLRKGLTEAKIVRTLHLSSGRADRWLTSESRQITHLAASQHRPALHCQPYGSALKLRMQVGQAPLSPVPPTSRTLLSLVSLSAHTKHRRRSASGDAAPDARSNVFGPQPMLLFCVFFLFICFFE